MRQSVVRVDSHRNMKVCATTASPSESLFSDFFFCGPRFSFSITAVARSCLTSRQMVLPRPTDSPSFHSGTDSMLLIVHTENCSSGSLARTVPDSSVCGGENSMVHPPSPVLTASGSALKVSVEVYMAWQTNGSWPSRPISVVMTAGMSVPSLQCVVMNAPGSAPPVLVCAAASACCAAISRLVASWSESVRPVSGVCFGPAPAGKKKMTCLLSMPSCTSVGASPFETLRIRSAQSCLSIVIWDACRWGFLGASVVSLLSPMRIIQCKQLNKFRPIWGGESSSLRNSISVLSRAFDSPSRVGWSLVRGPGGEGGASSASSTFLDIPRHSSTASTA